MKLLIVTRLAHPARGVYAMKWRSGMKVLLVSKLSHTARAVNTTAKYIAAGRALGHEVAVFGEQQSEPPDPFGLELDHVVGPDLALYRSRRHPSQ